MSRVLQDHMTHVLHFLGHSHLDLKERKTVDGRVDRWGEDGVTQVTIF